MNTKTVSPDISIREAQLADLDKLVELHMNCFSPREHLAVRLGRSYIRAAYRWFITSSETFTILAEDMDCVVGLTTICDRSYNRPMLRHTLREAVLAFIMRPWLVFHPEVRDRIVNIILSRRGVGEASPSEEGVAHLAFIAVASSARGKGVGDALLQYSIKDYMSRNYRRIRAGVYKENHASTRMFERNGFNEAPELETKHTVFMEVQLAHDPTRNLVDS